MTITAFDRDNLKTLGADIDTALAAVAEKHGIAFRKGAIRYDIGSFSVTLNATIPAAKAESDMRDAKMFAEMLGVDISQPSTHPMRKGATVTGFDSKKRSKPWKFAWNGKAYITDDAGIRIMFPAKSSGLVEVDNLIAPTA